MDNEDGGAAYRVSSSYKAIKMRPRCDQDAIKMGQRCDPDAIQMRSRCDQDATKTRPRRDQDAGKMRSRWPRQAFTFRAARSEYFGGRSEQQVRDSIVVSISACHAEDPGSIPGRGIWVGFRGLLGAKRHQHRQQEHETNTLPGRLELPTLRLTASRSNQLSYGSRCFYAKT